MVLLNIITVFSSPNCISSSSSSFSLQAMDRLLLIALFSLLTTVSLLAAAPSGPAWNDNRYRDYDYNGGRYEEGARGRDAAKGGDDDLAPGPIGGTVDY